MPLGAVVAAPGGERLVLPVAEHLPLPCQDVDDLAAGVVGVQSDGGTGFQRGAHDLAQFVHPHPGMECAFPAQEAGDDLLLHFGKIDQHRFISLTRNLSYCLLRIGTICIAIIIKKIGLCLCLALECIVYGYIHIV